MAQKNTILAGIAIAGGALLCALGSPLVAQNVPAGTNASKMAAKGDAMSAGDAGFAKDAAIGGMMEVELGRIATQNASSDKVKQFGQRMVDDHTKAGNELKAVAAKHNLTLPDQLDSKHQMMVDRFSKMSGAQFDREYMSDMVKDHETDIADFRKETSSGSNRDLKDFAAATLPTLQDHLRQARETQSTVGAVSQK
jgi:putative membrane protein